ncbi:disintegrin and metalloproteinase domain-containing protein 10-like [Acanthaster planci]|uniref:ADAM10 endopeptidase n=1 Tax=Acanthaster planci TaxID=133434 RepID=A0A8B7ZYQ1_ACAPL|nr:disintegrin and metalloproteinase domain-containing protein 10-like [Acanthaster planci]
MSRAKTIFALILLTSWESGASKAPTLSPFIRHYEMLNYDLEAVHQQHRRAVRSLEQSNVELKFTAHSRDFHLRLKRDTSVFLPSVTLETSNGDEVPEVNYFYSGELAGETGSYCHGSIVDGLFQGKIHVGEEVYSVEPAANYMKNPDSHSVIYEAKDVDYSSLGSSGCGMVGQIQKRMEERLKEMQKEEKMEDRGDSSSYFARHKRQAPSAQTCTLFIRTDIEFFERFGSKLAVIRQIGDHVQAASQIYSRTTFGDYTDINFAVAKIRIYTEADRNSPEYPFRDENLGVEKYLDYASNGDLSAYCLAYTFTNRDFANGVLGLAWIATDVAGSTGGLCAPKLSSRDTTLNTGIVTINNYGSYVPPLMSHNTLAHEIGHSFGSNHDPMDNQVCSPGGTSGNYLMFAHASSGVLANNDDFSICSIDEITRVLRSVFMGVSKRNCFVEQSSVTLCGNGILEENEMCDCGYEGMCGDSCCIAQNAENNRVNACQLTSTAMCSPQQGDCCDPMTCSYQPISHVCKTEDECSLSANCTGNSVRCSNAVSRPDSTKCDNGRKVCSNGACSLSVCSIHNLEECQCSTETEKCEICCQNPDQPASCVAASRINIRGPNEELLYKDAGSPCDDYMGYCDFFDSCRLANEDGPLAGIIRKIFFSEEDQLTDVIWSWIMANWWVILIIVVVLIIVMILVVFVCERLIPTTNPWHKEKEQLMRRASANVQLQKKRNRGSRYYGDPPPPTSFDQHPDNAEKRATRF